MPDHGRNHRADSSYPVTANRARPAPVFPLQEKRGNRLVAVLGAVTAVVVTAAVLLAVMSVVRAPTGPADPVQGAPPTIAGSKVFRPDVISSAIEEADAKANGSGQQGWRPDGGMDGTGGSESSAQGDPGEADATEDDGTPADGTQPSTTGSATGSTEPASGSTVAAASAGGERLCATLQVTDPTLCRLLDPVQEFYALVTTDPERAFAMLDSSLQGGDAQSFAQAWSQVEAATVDSAELVDRNTVQVQVTYLRTDDRKVITVQRLELRGGAKPRILRAQLLSAVFG